MAISFAILKQSRVILSFVFAVQAGRVRKLCIVPDPIPFQVTGIVIHSQGPHSHILVTGGSEGFFWV